MSERGSLATQYIYCRECRESVLAVLSAIQNGYVHDVTPIAGGVILAAMYRGMGELEFRCDVAPVLSSCICHPVVLALLPDDGAYALYEVRPNHNAVAYDDSTVKLMESLDASRVARVV